MAKIATLLEHSENRRLLGQHLSDHHVLAPVDGSLPPDDEIDLVILDAGAFHRCREGLRARRNLCEPLLLPVLLVVSPRELARLTLPNDLIEEVIVTPIRKTELSGRIQTLIKLRELSKQQQEKRIRAEQALSGVTRAFRAFSACNEAIVRADDETGLLNDVCGLLIREGGYSFAWVGYVYEDDDHHIHPLASSSAQDDSLNDSRLRWAKASFDGGPVAKALQTDKPAVASEYDQDPAIAAWRESGFRHGLAAAISLVIRVYGQTVGVLTICSAESNAFDDSEVAFLKRLVNNLAHGVQVLRDSLYREEQERRVAYLAYRDTLTGLSNRACITEALADLADSGTRAAALLFIDLDGFKVVNDALGHDVGDQLLQSVAHRLQQVVREPDLIARQGGDEFILFMRYKPRDGGDNGEDPGAAMASAAEQVADRIIRAVSSPFAVNGEEHYINASVGISIFPKDTDHGSALLTQADNAMYAAKEAGGGSFRFYSENLSEAQRHRLQLETRLRRAIINEEFELYFQPIIDVSRDEAVAMEALIRWPQSDGTVVSPGQFMPLAEQNGMITAIGDWVLREVIDIVSNIPADRPQLQMLVNLSVNQFWEPGFIDRVLDLVYSRHISPDFIGFEVTESAMMQDSEQLIDTLRHFHEHGFGMAVDDFGTGYSSLWRLRDLPFTSLKIDKSFLDEVPENAEAFLMINAIIQMAHSLNLKVIAEGVETEAQYATLRELGCDYAQGFFFARPQPIAVAMREVQKEGLDVSPN